MDWRKDTNALPEYVIMALQIYRHSAFFVINIYLRAYYYYPKTSVSMLSGVEYCSTGSQY